MTTNLKPLERGGLLKVSTDEVDRRTRRLKLTKAGRTVLEAAVPIWERTTRMWKGKWSQTPLVTFVAISRP